MRSRGSRQKSFRLLKILQSLVEKDKSVLPAFIKFQDRGKMTFPERNFLPSARSCSYEIKKILKPSKYKLLGRKLLLVSINTLKLKIYLLTVCPTYVNRSQNKRFWATMTYSAHLRCLLGIIKQVEWMMIMSGFCSRRSLHV